MLRDKRFGVDAIVSTMNDWIDEIPRARQFHPDQYEALRAAPAEHLDRAALSEDKRNETVTRVRVSR